MRKFGVRWRLFTAPSILGLEGTGVMHNTTGRNALALPARGNSELRVGLSFAADHLDYDRRDRRQQEDLVAKHFAGAGWQVPRLLAAMREAEEFFFDSSGQVVMDSWSTGRTALLGDAAHCAAPTSGRGTSQALIGAYVLAGELAETPGHATAFAAYERHLRGYVERNQRHGRAAARWFLQPPTEPPVEVADDVVPLKHYA
ncbi:FAD-dependent monooxygenase [Nonomuraea sp. NPDC049400]|uniref:FAD-dependent monooxygenase n=1 Tax=Nonomuraea sp. NPDC049400 TaxID=3364352 RepID=UPI00379AEF1E